MRTKPKRLTGKDEIDHLVKGFGGRIGDKVPVKVISKVKLASEETADLKREIAHAQQL